MITGRKTHAGRGQRDGSYKEDSNYSDHIWGPQRGFSEVLFEIKRINILFGNLDFKFNTE